MLILAVLDLSHRSRGRIFSPTAAALGLLYRAEKRYWLIEPDALLVILIVVGALCLVYFQ